MRFACIFVPHFAVQAALRCEPDRKCKRNQPVAILDGPDSLLRVFAGNPSAQCAGIEIGMTKVQAEQCPGLVLRKRVIAQEKSAQSALIDCASAFSPLIESTAEGAVTFEVSGTNRAFGPPEALARRVTESAARLGLEVNVALAENPDAALVAAKGSNGIVLIPSGEEADYLATLPIQVLSLTPERAEILDTWGIRTCGDLAALRPLPLVERLGQAGLQLHTLARGKVHRNLIAIQLPQKFEERIELEDPVTDLESLAFLFNRLLTQIFARLGARGLATDGIRLRLDLEIHPDRDTRQDTAQPSASAAFERRLKSPVPIKDTKTFLKLLQLDLAAHNPAAPVKAVAIEAIPAKPRHTQVGLFAPRSPEPERLEVTLARLRAVVGEVDEQGRGRVGAPEPCDSYKPDNFRVLPFELRGTTGNHSRFQETDVALSVFRPPLTARVRRKRNEPVHISFAEFSAPVLFAAGPWFTSGLWWDETEKWNREEWDIAIRINNGLGLFRIFHENQTWSVEGLYG
jgi:protein ImuB